MTLYIVHFKLFLNNFKKKVIICIFFQLKINYDNNIDSKIN